MGKMLNPFFYELLLSKLCKFNLKLNDDLNVGHYESQTEWSIKSVKICIFLNDISRTAGYLIKNITNADKIMVCVYFVYIL